MILVVMESESYTWSAFGNTEEEAKKAILKKWNSAKERKHMKNIEELEEWYGFESYNSDEMGIGKAYFH